MAVSQFNLIAQHKRLMAEGYPRTLDELFIRTGITPEECRHTVVDIQNGFIETESLERVANHVRQSIAPAFNVLGISTYWIYWPRDLCIKLPRNLEELPKEGLHDAAAELYPAMVAANDRILPKQNLSALSHLFKEIPGLTLTHQALKKDRVKMIFADGIFFSACLGDTVKDACRKGYHVAVLTDGMDGLESDRPGFDRYELQSKLEKLGAIFTTSEEAVAALNRLRLKYPLPR